MRRNIVLFVTSIIVLVLFLGVGYKLLTTGRVEITGDSSLKYEIHNQADGKLVKNGELKNGKTTQTLSSGNYELTVFDDESNYYRVLKVPRFFGVARVFDKPKTEVTRAFIAESPSGCTHLLGELLLSHSCSGPANSIRLHIPATNDEPAKAVNISSMFGRDVEQTFEYQGKLYALIQKAGSETSYRTQELHQLYSENNALKAQFIGELRWIDAKTIYRATPYKDGILIYSLEQNKAYFYESLSSLDKPIDFSLPTPNDKKLSATTLIANSDNLAVLFSTPESDDYKQDRAKSEIALLGPEDYVHHAFGKVVKSPSFCGKFFCIIEPGGRKLIAYSADDWSKKFELTGVKQIASKSDKEMFVATGRGLLVFDIEEKSGSFIYTSRGYEFLGFTLSNGNGVSVNIKNKSASASLLLNDLQKDKTIDNKILSLENDSAVKSVSVYKNYVYISPDLGDMKYDTQAGGFSYSEDTKNTAREKIKNKLSQLNLEGYEIHIPLLD